MSGRRKVSARAKALGAEIEQERSSGWIVLRAFAPGEQRWAGEGLHTLLAQWLPGDPEGRAAALAELLERMAGGLEPCMDPDCCGPAPAREPLEALEDLARQVDRMGEQLRADVRPGHVDHLTKAAAGEWAATLAAAARCAAAKGREHERLLDAAPTMLEALRRVRELIAPTVGGGGPLEPWAARALEEIDEAVTLALGAEVRTPEAEPRTRTRTKKGPPQ